MGCTGSKVAVPDSPALSESTSSNRLERSHTIQRRARDIETFTMECAEISGAGQALRIAKRPVPEAPPNGVLLRTAYAGICHTDLHYIDDELDFGCGKVFRHRDVLGDKFVGSIPGHEISGDVIAIGKSAKTDLKVGDKVIVYPWIGCQSCSICAASESQLCDNNRSTTTDYGKGRDGGYSTHVTVDDCKNVIKVADDFPMDMACMLPCSAVTAYGALKKCKEAIELAQRIRNKATLLLIGVGGLGLWGVSMAKKVLGDVTIIAADVGQDKIDTAIAQGADSGVVLSGLSKEEQLAKIREIAPIGVTAAIDFVGLPEKTTALALESLHKAGTVVCIGFYGGSMPLSVPGLVSRTASLQGSRVSSIANLREVVDLVQSSDFKCPPFETLALNEVNAALDKLRTGKLRGRGLIKPC